MDARGLVPGLSRTSATRTFVKTDTHVGYVGTILIIMSDERIRTKLRLPALMDYFARSTKPCRARSATSEPERAARIEYRYRDTKRRSIDVHARSSSRTARERETSPDDSSQYVGVATRKKVAGKWRYVSYDRSIVISEFFFFLISRTLIRFIR